MTTNPHLPKSAPTATARRGVVVMVLSVAGFTVNTMLLRYLSGGERAISPELPLLFRALVGMVLVLVLFRGKRPTRVKPVFREPLLILRGVVGLLGTAAYYWTVPKLGAGMATLICNTYVIFASIIAVLALNETLTRARFLWLIAAFVGIILLVGPNAEVGEFRFGKYEVIAIIGAVLAAWAVVLIRRLVADHSIGTIYLAQCVWIVLPVVFLAGPKLGLLEAGDVALLVIAGCAAGFGQLAMNEGYRCLPVSTGASIQMAWPVACTVGGWYFFGEILIPLQIVGAVLILASIWRMSVSAR